MRISIGAHKERMANRRADYHQRISDVPAIDWNRSKYWPNVCKARGER